MPGQALGPGACCSLLLKCVGARNHSCPGAGLCGPSRPQPPPPPHLPAHQAALGAGKGRLRRDTESGALLLDLTRHGDVVEYAAWINSFSDQVYKALWGDKVGWGWGGWIGVRGLGGKGRASPLGHRAPAAALQPGKKA